MKLLVRHYQRVRPENWEKNLELAKRWTPIGKRLGIPPDRFCQCFTSADGIYTLINEREYDDLSAWQAALDKMQADPENQALGKEQTPLIEDWRMELLGTVDLE